jgi:hypothetical protein
LFWLPLVRWWSGRQTERAEACLWRAWPPQTRLYLQAAYLAWTRARRGRRRGSSFTLCAEADSEENLRRVQGFVTEHLGRFGRRDHLTVNWQQPEAPSLEPGEAG